MTAPPPTVEIAFGYGPYSVPPGIAWVDVTSYVLEFSTRRGRTSEFEHFPAGTASFTLNNDSRRFDPLNTASPYSGQLLANTPIRVTAAVSSFDMAIWRGLVDGWPATYTDGGYRSEVTIECTDAFRVLAERLLPDTFAMAIANLVYQPDAWYHFDNPTKAGILSTGTKGQPGIPISAITDESALTRASTGALGLPSQTAALTGQLVYAVEFPIPLDERDNLTRSAVWSIAVLVQMVNRGQRGVFASSYINGSDPVIELGVTATTTGGVNLATGYVAAGPTVYIVGNTDVGDGRPHMLVLTRSSGTVRLYVDGKEDTETPGFNAGMTGAYDFTGGVHRLGRSAVGPATSPPMNVDELMGFSTTVLNAAEVDSLYNAFITGFADTMLAGEAISAVLDLIEWPADLRDLDAGTTPVTLPFNPVGTSVLTLLQRIADCEDGRLYMDADGRVVFHDRSHATLPIEAIVQKQFTSHDDSATPPDCGLIDGSLSLTLDDRLAFDAAEVTRIDGTTQRATLANTTTPNRTRSLTALPLSTDQYALSLANWIVSRYSTAQPRSDAFTLDPEIGPAGEWLEVLSLDIGHRIRHDLTPAVGSRIILDQHVTSIEHDVSPARWLITMNGHPVDAHDAVYFTWATVATSDPDNGWASTSGTPYVGGYWG